MVFEEQKQVHEQDKGFHKEEMIEEWREIILGKSVLKLTEQMW